LGSIREITDDSGNVRAEYAYDPFGVRTQVSGNLNSDFGFAGMFWSPEAGLSLTRFRAYDAVSGRWLSRDPLRDAEIIQGPNLYAYAANDPVSATDPLGLLWWWDAGQVLFQRVTFPPYEDDHDYDVTGDELGFLTDFETVLGPGLDAFADSGFLEIEETMFTSYIPSSDYQLIQVERPGIGVNPFTPTKLGYPGIAGPISLVLGAEITILTMTDCNTVNGIMALVRQGKGGLANYYEDQDMKELQRIP
jgi:RHS repeat-associated protein